MSNTDTDISTHAVDVNDKTLKHLLSGKAIFTLESKATGTRFTYKVTKKQEEGKSPIYFVGLLNGPNNTRDYAYLAFMGSGDLSPRITAKSCASPNSKSFMAIQWAFTMLNSGKVEEFSNQVKVWHEGRCFSCGRVLTVPESIETGLGPICAEKV